MSVMSSELDSCTSSSDLPPMVFRERQVLDGARFVRQMDVGFVEDPVAVLPADAVVDHEFRYDRRVTVLASTALGSVLVVSNAGSTRLSVAASSSERADLLLAQLSDVFPDVPVPDDVVPLAVWNGTSHGADVNARDLLVPSWPEVERNYPARVRRHLDALMGASGGGRGGRLVIFHGPPGTGKTTAIRALFHSWRDWCQAHYIADPEHLFGEAAYMVEVLNDDVSCRRSPRRTPTSKPEWRLLVAEDCDDYLRASARESSASLGRLLNLTDGILGQGQQVLTLLTTNEDLDRLHPAITRPGRCMAVVEFARFEPSDAARWLDGRAPTPTSAQTLAELYAAIGDVDRVGDIQVELERPGQYV